MTSGVKMGTAINPERTQVTYNDVVCSGARKPNNIERTSVDYDYVVYFFLKVKSPKKLDQIVINKTEIGDIIGSNPYEFTSGFLGILRQHKRRGLVLWP